MSFIAQYYFPLKSTEGRDWKFRLNYSHCSFFSPPLFPSQRLCFKQLCACFSLMFFAFQSFTLTQYVSSETLEIFQIFLKKLTGFHSWDHSKYVFFLDFPVSWQFPVWLVALLCHCSEKEILCSESFPAHFYIVLGFWRISINTCPPKLLNYWI